MNAREAGPVGRPMSAEERARLVIALDHDLRQPQHSAEMGLRTLRLIAADLKSGRYDKGTLDSLLHRLSIEIASVQAAHRQLVDAQRDLIDVVLLDAGERPPQSRTIRAGDLIDRICGSNRPTASTIQLHGLPSRLTFFSDERYVARILNNLLANAIRHAGATRIVLCARRREGDIVFEVRDNGMGMPPERIEQVLGTGEATSLPAFPGAKSTAGGIGLSIVRLFAERLGGSIGCRSLVNRGTLIQLRLPGPLGTSEAPCRLSRSAATGAQNKVVAVLDDDLAALRSSERVFRSMGIEIYADHDPLRWLSVVTDLRRAPDLFLLDYRLKEQDCSLQLDIVQRKWGRRRTKVLVLAENGGGPSLARVAKLAPVLGKPLTDAKYEYILDVLAGRRQLPMSGFLSVGEP